MYADYKFSISRNSKLARINTSTCLFVFRGFYFGMTCGQCQFLAANQCSVNRGDINRAQNDVLRNNELIAKARRRVFISIKI